MITLSTANFHAHRDAKRGVRRRIDDPAFANRGAFEVYDMKFDWLADIYIHACGDLAAADEERAIAEGVMDSS